MSRICVFKPLHTLTEISDCSRHVHISRAKADERLKRGEIAAFDATGNRFVERGGASLNCERVRPYRPPTLPMKIIEAAAVAAADEEKDNRAREIVEHFGADVLPVPKVSVDQDDVWFYVGRGVPLLAVLKHQQAEVVENARKFLAGRQGKLDLGAVDFHAEFEKLRTRMRDLRQEDRTQTLKKIWPDVLVQFACTGREAAHARSGFAHLMGHLTATPPEELPATLVYWTVTAYMRGK